MDYEKAKLRADLDALAARVAALEHPPEPPPPPPKRGLFESTKKAQPKD